MSGADGFMLPKLRDNSLLLPTAFVFNKVLIFFPAISQLPLQAEHSIREPNATLLYLFIISTHSYAIIALTVQNLQYCSFLRTVPLQILILRLCFNRVLE